MNIRLLPLFWVAISGCNALADFPEPDVQDAATVVQDATTGADASDMGVVDQQVDAEAGDMAPDLNVFPARFESCPSGHIKLRPRIAITGSNTNAMLGWVDPTNGVARLQAFGSFGPERAFPAVERQAAPLDFAVSVDIGYHAVQDETESFSYSLTRAFTPEFGVALYPTSIPRGLDRSSLAWGTALSGMFDHLLGAAPESEDRRWFWFESVGQQRVQIRSTPASGDEMLTSTSAFCPPMMGDECAAPDPVQADAFGSAAGIVFMRDQNGFAWAWDHRLDPGKVDLGNGPVLFDDIAVLTENRAEGQLLIAEFDGQIGSAQIYRAVPQESPTTEFEVEPLSGGLVEVGTDVRRIALVGSDGVWHLMTTTPAGNVEIFLRDDGALKPVKDYQLNVPGEFLAWDVFAATLQAPDPSLDVPVWIAYAGGDECSFETTAERISLPRRLPPE